MIVKSQWIIFTLLGFLMPSPMLLAQSLLGPSESSNDIKVLEEEEIAELAGGAKLAGSFRNGRLSNNGETGYVFLFNETLDVHDDVHLIAQAGLGFNCKDYSGIKSCARSVIDAPVPRTDHVARIAGDVVFSAAYGGEFGTNIKDAKLLTATLDDVRLMLSVLAKSRDVNRAEFREFREQPSRFITSISIDGVGRGWEGRVVSVTLWRYEYRAINLRFKDGKPRNYRIHDLVF